MKNVRFAGILVAAVMLLASATPAFAMPVNGDNGQVNGDVEVTARLSLMITGDDLHYGSPAQGDVDVKEINDTRTVFTNTGDVQSGLFIQGDAPAKAAGKDAYWEMTNQADKDAFVWSFNSDRTGTVDVITAAATDLGSLGYNDAIDFGSVIDMPSFSTQIGTYEWSATAWVTSPE